MADLIPVNWRESVQHLRQDISDAFARWLAKLKRSESVDDDPRASPMWTSWGSGLELDGTDDELIVPARLPGLSKNDFKVEVTEGRLVVRGERQSSKNGRQRYQESHAAFAQAVSLP